MARAKEIAAAGAHAAKNGTPLRLARPKPIGLPHAMLPSAAGLDRVIHEQARLGILAALAVNEPLSFNDLKRILKTTDGNLSVHARKLETAGYVACRKFFQGRVPKTEFALTGPGRRAFERYLDQMELLIQSARPR